MPEKTNIRLSKEIYEQLKKYKEDNGIQTFSDCVYHLLCQGRVVELLEENNQLLLAKQKLITQNKDKGC